MKKYNVFSFIGIALMMSVVGCTKRRSADVAVTDSPPASFIAVEEKPQVNCTQGKLSVVRHCHNEWHTEDYPKHWVFHETMFAFCVNQMRTNAGQNGVMMPGSNL